MQLPGTLLGPSSKNKNNPSKENFLYFLVLILKNFLYSQENPCFLRNGDPKKLLIFQEVTFVAEKLFLIFHGNGTFQPQG